MDQPVIRGGFLMLQVTFCIHNFLDYLRKDSACASGEYGLFQFIFESLPQKKVSARWMPNGKSLVILQKMEMGSINCSQLLKLRVGAFF